MGAFDDAMKNAVPGGNLATPIAVAVGALILGKMFGGSSAPSAAAPAPGASRPRLRSQCRQMCRPAASWADSATSSASSPPAGPRRRSIPGSAPAPISRSSPGQLGSALGQSTLNELSQRTGMSQQELSEPARDRPAAAHQPSDPQWAHADVGAISSKSSAIVGDRAARSAPPVPSAIPRRDGAARPPCRAPAPDPRSDPRRPRGRPTTAKARGRCRAPPAARA